MKNIKYALLLDDLRKNDQSKAILEHLSSRADLNLRIFLLDKEDIYPNPFPVFNIADYFNFGKGVSIITSDATRRKAESYPVTGLFIALGKDIPGYINIEEFNLNLIEKVANEHFRYNKDEG